MNILDTRKLIEKRSELKVQIANDFLDKFDDIRGKREDIKKWEEDGKNERNLIEKIDFLENEIGSDKFEAGIILIEETDFEKYINSTYSKVEFKDGTYFYKNI